ncbi:ArsR/SmtB family transcription factor [Noviherbaspirillum galbum]|uniref:Winged helix-turn-helix transcriptional regulator n=1 Tax=Noviherbaspirillum galbum TaxID=2709383 RepID=A0A6B3SQX7_9BURK|nr:metalloregulator ArsR/SmtB family transcription factor [Noviherbaspirillum galbum]NEX63330.1 winged helix-turn-helix transcriptional regulator [Noviherbaspirillum galbum]
MTSCCAPATPKEKKAAIDADDLALLCKALGHPARVKLLQHLTDYGACFFGSLADVVGLAPSTTSQHVTILKEAGLIFGSSDEKRVCYCINPERLAHLKSVINLL